jgi:ribonuclease BN (tRNA processing enzyme)
MSTRIVMLGTGTPNPDPERMGPSLAIVTDGEAYLVDFGPGIVRRAALACERGIHELAVENLKTAFLTHLHSDHTVGYADLIFTPWVCGREKPVEVYGPRGLSSMTRHLLAPYDMDKRQRVCGLEPISPAGYGAQAYEISAGQIFRNANLRVSAFSVEHGEWDAFGFRFETHDRTIVVSGDTAPTDAMIDACRGCDVLVHEVYSAKGFAQRPPEWQRYHAAMHTSTVDLARIASRIKPGLLVLTHQLFMGVSEADLLEEVRSRYSGEVVSARDLDVF